MNKGVSSWFHNVSTYSEEVIENKIFIENSFKFKKSWNLGTFFILLEKIRWIGFNEGVWIVEIQWHFQKN
jgi:hypothetical protein